MTSDEIIEKLGQEKTFGSRFPARMIFTENLSAYKDLVSKLKSVCDVSLNVAECCKSDDIPPRFNNVREMLSKYPDQQVLLLGVGEYLRICIKRELNADRAQFRSFWEFMQPENSKARCIMPVFCCRDTFDRVLGKVNERQEDYIWTLDSEPSNQSYQIAVYSPQFAGTINPDAENLKAWLLYWDTILSVGRPCTLITKQYKNVEAFYGTVAIKTIDSPFSYLSDTLADAEKLDKDWLNESFWAELIPNVRKGMKISDLILHMLNINDFDFVSIAARWKMLSDVQKSLVWLWYRIYPTDEYYSYACKKAVNMDEIPGRIRDDILHLSDRSDEWIDQRMKAVTAFAFQDYDENYFELIDRVPDNTKLRLLTYQTHIECAYAIKVVSKLLRKGIEADSVAEMIKDKYPVLAAYMKDDSGLDLTVDSYFKWYRTNKLINRFPGDSDHAVSFNKFDSRAKALHKMQGKDCYTLWIDGFGMEWLPAFLWELKKLQIEPESKSIVTSILPTETEYNHQWDENDPMSEKWNRLDSLSHKGMPDDKSYYSCIVYQLSVLSDAAKKVDDLLDKHEYVAITGDHGSSRLAALAFHDPSVIPVTAPKKATVRSFGRFCTFDDNAPQYAPLPGMELVLRDGKARYVVMDNYQHFSVGGNVAGGNTDENDVIGEVHGGNTPEERLVPVVIVKRSHPLPPMTCQPERKFVTKKNGCVETNLKFNRPVSSLEVSVGGNPASCVVNPDGSWHVVISSIPDEELKLDVVANGRLLEKSVDVKVKSRGITTNDDKMGI